MNIQVITFKSFLDHYETNDYAHRCLHVYKQQRADTGLISYDASFTDISGSYIEIPTVPGEFIDTLVNIRGKAHPDTFFDFLGPNDEPEFTTNLFAYLENGEIWHEYNAWYTIYMRPHKINNLLHE